MATLSYHKLQQGALTHKPGSNWWWIRLDFALMPAAQNDTLKIAETKNHWILKSCLNRTTVACTGAATMDLGTGASGNQIDDAIDIDSGTDTWLRADTLDDDGPVAITADGYIYATVLDAAVSNGIIDVMLEVIIPHPNVDDYDHLA